MNTARLSLSLAIMLSWALSSPALAQQNLPPGQAMVEDCPAEAGVSDLNTRSIFDNSNYMIRGDAGDGVGYIRGFQTLAAFQPIMVSPDEFIFWVSPRGIVTYNSGDFGANLGAGVRWLEPTSQRILGAGFWYDHDQNGYGTNNDSVRNSKYDQLGGSGEWLGNMFDFRINAYVPTNSNVHVVAQSFTPSSSPFFVGNNIAVGQNTFIINNALKGGDFEGGGALPGIGDLGIRAYAGGYYYEGQFTGGGLYGVRGRLEALITQNLWGTVIVTHDRIFGTNVSAAGTIYLGSGEQPRFFGRIPMTTRLYQQMERQYRVAVQQSVQTDLALALRAGGTGGSGGPIGTPIFVDHVDNTAAAGGNGTVEHPFNTLPKTTPGNVDIIFVNRGDGTSTGMNQGITLNNFQRLLGDGVQHQFTSLQGVFTLPGFTPGTPTPGTPPIPDVPMITNINPDGTAVRLASNNEVSGFKIVNPGGYGISNLINAGTPDTSTRQNFNINNVFVSGAGSNPGAFPSADAVHLEQYTGVGTIANSTFNNNLTGYGIFLNNTNPPLLATDKLVLNVGGTTANNVTANGNGKSGIFLTATGTEIDPHFNNVITNNNAGDGIQISLTFNPATGAGAIMNGTFANVTSNNNNNPFVSNVIGSGFNFTSSYSTANIAVTNSTFNSNGLNGVNIVVDSPSVLAPPTGTSPSVFVGTFDQITANSNGPTSPAGFGNGFAYESFNSASGNVTITRSTFDTNFANGTLFTTHDNSTLVQQLINNNSTINGNTLDGASYVALDNSSITGTLLNNIITNNGGVGIDVSASGTSTVNFTIGGYLAQTSVGQVISIPSLNVPVETPPLILTNGLINREGNTITGNTGAGIAFALHDNATGTERIIGNIIQTTKVGAAPLVGQGIDIRLDGNAGTATGFTALIDGNTIGSLTNPALGNAGGGIVVVADGTSTISSLTIGLSSSLVPGNIIANNGTSGTGDGISITNLNGAVIGSPNPVFITSNQIVANAGNGISINAGSTAGLTSAYDIEKNTITSNTGEGLFLQNTGVGQVVNLTDASNTYTGNQNGIRIDNVMSPSGQMVTLLANNDTFTTNVLNGILINNSSLAPTLANPSNVVDATVTASTFTSNGQMGIQVEDTASLTNLTVGSLTDATKGNTFTSNHGAGIGYITTGTPFPATTVTSVLIGSNTITGTTNGTVPVAPGYGIDVSLNGFGRMVDLEIGGAAGVTTGTGAGSNTITKNSSDGIHLEVHDSVTLTKAIINNNTIGGSLANRNLGNGISILADGSSVIPATTSTINNNNDTFNSASGLSFVSNGSSNSTWTTSLNLFNNNGTGMTASSSGTATFNLTSTTDHFNNNTGNGITLTAGSALLDTTVMTVKLTNDQINSNGGVGVAQTTNGGATLNVNIDPCQINLNGTDGVRITTNDGSFANITIAGASTTNVNTINSNTQNGINVTTNDTSSLKLLISDTDISSNKADGYTAFHADGSLVSAVFTDDTITKNTDRGIDVSFTGTAGTNTAAGTGYFIQGTSAASATGTSRITNNGGEGIFLATTGNPTATLLAPANNVLFVVTNTFLASNTPSSGPATPNLSLAVGTGSQIFADVEHNVFQSNLTDFTTSSTGIGPAQSQLYLRFLSNSDSTGGTVAPAGGTGQVFQVEDTYQVTKSALNDTNTFSGTPNIKAAFTAGGFSLVTSPGPAPKFSTPPMPTYDGPGP